MNPAAIFRPNDKVNKQTSLMLVAGWAVLALAFWYLSPIKLLPKPGEVLTAFQAQWMAGAGYQLWVSLIISLQAIACATIVGLGLAYAATIPLFRPLADAVARLRSLSLAGLIVVFILISPNGHILKVSVLTFAMVTFFLTTMLQVIDDIPAGKFDHARTLGLSRLVILREVVVRGTLDQALEAIRMNAAMAWMMLTMVEGLSRSEGGIGVLLLNLQRSGNYAAIFAMQILIFLVGVGQDKLLKFIKAKACPYTVRG